MGHQPAGTKQRPASASVETGASDTRSMTPSRVAEGAGTPQVASSSDATQAQAQFITRTAQPSRPPCSHEAPAAAGKASNANPQTANFSFERSSFSAAGKAPRLSTASKGSKLGTAGKAAGVTGSKLGSGTAKTIWQAAKPFRASVRTS